MQATRNEETKSQAKRRKPENNPMYGILETNFDTLKDPLLDHNIQDLEKRIDRIIEKKRHVCAYFFCFLDMNVCDTSQRFNLFFDFKV